MTTIELRTSVLAEIASIMDNEDLLKKALDALRNLKKKEIAVPCRFTTEELNKILDRSMEDIKAGNVVTREEMMRDIYNQFL